MNPTQIKSTHRCEVVRVNPQPHGNADKLEVVNIYGYTVCVGKGDFKDGDLGVYIPPDSIVPQTKLFQWFWESKGFFLDENPTQVGNGPAIVPERYRRVKAKKLRGIVSEGMLTPLPRDIVAMEGDDVAKVMGITHYEPVEPPSTSGDCESEPTKVRKYRYPRSIRGWIRFIWYKIFPSKTLYGHEENTGLKIPAYDIDAWQRFKGILEPKEKLWLTEKIHGSNIRFTYRNNRMYVGSHYQWKANVGGSTFWAALDQNPWIEQFCKQFPGYVLYGELVPTQSKMKYGLSGGQYRVFGFDVLDPSQPTPGSPQGKWLNYEELEQLDFTALHFNGEELEGHSLLSEMHWVPTVGIIEYDEKQVRDLSNGPSLVPHAGHIREGIVMRPLIERQRLHFGRVILKLVSTTYLESKNSE